jgi:ribosomal protein L27
MGATISPDPQSLNRYSYCENDPVNFVDPSGLMMEGGVSCYIDGVESDCGLAFRMVKAGAAVIGHEQTTRWNPDANLGQGGWEFFRALADGRVGWFNIQGVSITVSAALSHAEMGAWFAGSHTYKSEGVWGSYKTHPFRDGIHGLPHVRPRRT